MSGRRTAAHRWAAVRSPQDLADIVKTRPDRSHAWHYEKRNDKAHGDLRDAITSTANRLENRIENRFDRIETRFDRIETRFDQMDERLRNVEQGFARVDQRLATLERVVLPPATASQ